MNTQHNLARIARAMALVVLGVAILAAGVSSVFVSLWVLLMAVPLAASLLLVPNLLHGAAQDNPSRVARVTALLVLGIALLAAGLSSLVTLWTSSFARFMYLEDLGLEGTTAGALVHITPVDRGLLVSGGILTLVGAGTIIAALLARRRWRAWR